MRQKKRSVQKNLAVIGIDVGGTKTLAVLFDGKFQVLDEQRFKTEPSAGPKMFERNLGKTLRHLVTTAKQKNKTVIGTGIGCSGSINSDSTELDLSPHIPFLEGFGLGKRIARLTGTKVYLANDVQMGLYGEQQLGAARGALHALGVFIGTGIGGAMIIDGKLHRGVNGIAGDIGHYLIQPLGPLGGSERQGTLDNVASRTAMAAEAAVFASRQWAPNLLKIAGTDVDRIRSKALARAIELGDDKIEELVRSRSHIVGIVLSNLVDFINPEIVVLGGGLVEDMPDLVRDAVEAGIQAHTTPAAAKNLRVVVAEFKGRAVAVGAAKMAWDKFNENAGQEQAEMKAGVV